MTLRSQLAEKIVAHYTLLRQDPSQAVHCFVGFDGFTDDVVFPIDIRGEGGRVSRITSMAAFGERIIAAASKSCNIELLPYCCKMGGNAPITTSALIEGGHRITFVGAIGGHKAVEPLFGEMARRCELVIPLCPSAHSDAIEFEDGKVILGKLSHLAELSYQKLIDTLSQRTLVQLLERASLLVCANWTMLPMMNDFWRQLTEGLASEMEPLPGQGRRKLFVDLADPAKRPNQDLCEALSLLSQLGTHYDVILSLNFAEAERLLRLQGEGPLKEQLHPTDVEPAREIAAMLAHGHGLHTVLLHSSRGAAAAQQTGEQASVKSAYTLHPRLLTGAGDNFNGGYCNGLLYGLTLEECLLIGVATAGYYIRVGKSPSIEILASFINHWEEGDASLERHYSTSQEEAVQWV